ncbi:hypothetical protein TNCV_992921 [Trichonephila clavipes]|nr:hypothetical protein TNCV_992921 [Trichonephila clavipes]
MAVTLSILSHCLAFVLPPAAIQRIVWPASRWAGGDNGQQLRGSEFWKGGNNSFQWYLLTLSLVNWADIENYVEFLSKEMPDVKIDDNCLFEVERRLNVYLNSNKLEKLENQREAKLLSHACATVQYLLPRLHNTQPFENNGRGKRKKRVNKGDATSDNDKQKTSPTLNLRRPTRKLGAWLCGLDIPYVSGIRNRRPPPPSARGRKRLPH